MQRDDTKMPRFKLDVNLAEYNRCFSEISARFTYQTAAFTILAAGIGALLAFARLTEPRTTAIVALFAPLFIAPLGYIFFDNELQIWRIARYVRYNLRERVVRLTGDMDSLALEGCNFGTNVSFRTIRYLSVGRWAIFVVPAGAAAILAAPHALSARWSTAVLAADVAAIAVLVAGVCAAVAEQISWNKPQP